MHIKKIDSLYFVLQSFILLDSLAFFILAEKYSGGDEGARSLALLIVVGFVSIFFTLFTIVYFVKINEAYFVLFKRLMSVSSLVLICFSLSLPVFFKYSIFTNIGLFLFIFYFLLLVYVCFFTIGYFVVNKMPCFEFLKAIIFDGNKINEREMFYFLPKDFFLHDKVPIVFGVILLASEFAGMSTRNIYPSFSSVAISVPLFVIGSYIFQRSLAGACFCYFLKKLQVEIEMDVFLKKKNEKLKESDLAMRHARTGKN